MDAKKLATGSVIGAVVLVIVGYIIFDVLFFDFYQANAGAAAAGIRESQEILGLVLGALAYGAMVTYFLSRQADGMTLAGGLKGGALIGFLAWATTDFTLYSYVDLWNLTVTLLDIGLETIRAGIAGAVVASVLGRSGN